MTEPSPRRRWLRIAISVVALLLAFATGAQCFGGGSEPADDHGLHDGADQVWTCSMHPQIRQGEPGDCPICGMDLIPAGGTGSDSTERIVLSERARALAELRTTVVVRQSDAAAEVRLLGRIEPAETTRRKVTTWIGGRIDRLNVNTTGERVRRGQTIARLYSPEVYSAHQDLLTAQSQLARMTGSSALAQQAAQSALDSARERLRLLGVPESEVESMAGASEPTRSVAIRSPFSGTVIDRVATEGAYVETGATLYRVADLSTLWVQLDAYESDLARLDLGQTVALVVEAFQGETFAGRVAFIDPTVDAERRTSRVRVEVDNADGRLRPGMFAEAMVTADDASDGSPLVVPATAPLFTGRRSVVYVEVPTEGGVAYEPRTVRLGPRLGEVYPVVSGLSEGDRVVTRGAFAVDADLQIRGGASMMTAADDRTAQAAEPISLTHDERAQLAPVLRAYLSVQTALAEDDHAGAATAAEALVATLTSVELPASATAAWTEISAGLRGHGTHVARSADIEGARGGFEPLSQAAERMLARFGNPLDEPVRVAFCPMAMGNEGARWVQQGETIDNAYFGASMRTCGDIEETVAPGTYLDTAPAPAPPSPARSGHQH